MLVQHFLSNAAKVAGQRNALWHQEQWHTYGSLYKQAKNMACCLAVHGLMSGDRVAVLMENSADYVISYFAVLMAGGVVVGLNPSFSPEEIRNLIDDCDANVVVVGKKQMRLLDKTGIADSGVALVIKEVEALNFGVPVEMSVAEAVAYDKPQPLHRRIDLDLAEIVYTSGSTGKPKGVMLSHLNLVANMHSIVSYLQLSEKDRAMVILPFYYIYGKSLLLSHFLARGSVVIDNRFMYPNKVIETMGETEVTNFSGVPSSYAILLSRSNIREADLPKLRMVTQAGGAMAVSLQQQVAELFAPARLWIMYGATEAAPRLSYLHPDFLGSKSGSIGRPVENVELCVVDDEGRFLPVGERGEIVARGSNIMMGYWREPDATDQVLRNGFYHTGDLGYYDEDGFLFVTGRKNDIIKVKGFRVSTKEIEERIAEIDSVEEVAVIGVENPLLGEEVKAYLVIKPGSELAEKEVVRYLRQHLPDYKIPSIYQFTTELPKNSSGKILKNQLKELNNE